MTSFVLFGVGLLSMLLTAANTAFGFLFLLGFFGGPVLFVYTIAANFTQRNMTEKKLTLGYLADPPDLPIGTADPAHIPKAEQNILARLQDLKAFLTQTHDLVTKRTIEL